MLNETSVAAGSAASVKERGSGKSSIHDTASSSRSADGARSSSVEGPSDSNLSHSASLPVSRSSRKGSTHAGLIAYADT